MSWSVPNMWKNGECWILGGGPSLTKEFDIPQEIVQQVIDHKDSPSVYSPYLSAIHNKHVIGINMAFKIGTWIDIVFFGDNGFFLENRKELVNFPKLKLTSTHRTAYKILESENIKYLPKDGNKPQGISERPDRISWNKNSGAAAISIAAHTGVKKIILVGFDMKLNETNKQHWHSLYSGSANNKPNMAAKSLPFHRHLLGFDIIAKDAKRMGIEIINACPDSAITVFPKCSVKDLL